MSSLIVVCLMLWRLSEVVLGGKRLCEGYLGRQVGGGLGIVMHWTERAILVSILVTFNGNQGSARIGTFGKTAGHA